MRAVGFVLCLSACACLPLGCASSQVPPTIAMLLPPEPTEPDMTAIAKLMGRFGIGHACPITETMAVTAAHVVDLRPFDPEVTPFPMVWADSRGREGIANPLFLGKNRDLAILTTEQPFSDYYPLYLYEPHKDMPLYFLGYDLRKRDDAFMPRVFKTRVVSVVGGMVFMRDAGTPGSSGSCVLSEAGEIVAINIGGMTLEDQRTVGVAVGLWPLADVLVAGGH